MKDFSVAKFSGDSSLSALALPNKEAVANKVAVIVNTEDSRAFCLFSALALAFISCVALTKLFSSVASVSSDFTEVLTIPWGFPDGSVVKKICLQCRRHK